MALRGTGPPSPAPSRRRATSIWPAVLLLAFPAAVAMLCNQPGTYVGDNRFEQYWSPGWRILRETMLWDGTRGMGRVGEEFWPLTLPLALLRSLGLSPAVTQHVWHGLLLVLAGTGVLNLVRVFQPRIGVAHLVAAAVYMANPYSVAFLVPSNLYWSYVLAPWLLVVALRGIRAESPREAWRWAAAWALLVFTAGDTDLPGLVFAVAWTVPVALFAVHVERWVTWRTVGSWVARAAVLTIGVSAAALVKVALGASALGQRLLYTETPAQVNTSSSWAESFRGLGYWLIYYRSPNRAAEVPGGLSWWESAPGILVTFALPVLALVALWRLRWRIRLMLMAIALPSLLLMVGSFDPEDPTPAGSLLLAAYRNIPSLSSLRNTYKAGSGALLAVSVLVGVGASALSTWSARRHQPWARPVGGVALALVIGFASLPFWNGGLYPEDRTLEAVPGYWIEATRWIEDQPGDARVLVLPGSTQTAYRWGWTGDDILDSLLRRHPHLVPTNFPLSGPLAANIIDALERRATEGSLTAEMLVPIAQRLGVGWVLIRNDLDWERVRQPRPALLDELRDSDALPLVRTFGRPGQHTTNPDDDSDEARAEAALPPIEIYRVPGPGVTAGDSADPADQPVDQVLARSTESPIFVDGDGDAWPSLAEAGQLDSGRPLRFAAAASDAEIAAALSDEASLVVTDTNRRRLTLIRGPGPTSSETLAVDQELGQAPQDLYGRPGTQSVAVYPDAVAVSASGSGSRLTGFTNAARPAGAFDGLASTAWRDSNFGDAVGSWIEVELREPRELSEVTLTPWVGPLSPRQISEATLHFDDGSSIAVAVPPGQASVPITFPPRSTRKLRVEITGVSGEGDGAVGFTEITIPGLDLTEYIAAPDHLFTATDPDLQSALAEGDVSYLFRRSIGQVGNEEELRLRRQFNTAGDRAWTLSAQFSALYPPVDQLVDRLLGSAIGAFGSSRVGTPGEARGGLAVDGDLTTAWAGTPKAGESLTVRFPSRAVQRVRVLVPNGPRDYPLRSVAITVGDAPPRTVEVTTDPDCVESDCPRLATLDLEAPVTATQIVVTTGDGDGGGRPVRIAEVGVEAPDGALAPASLPEAGGCAPGLINIDDAAVAVRVDGDVLEALDSGDVQLTSCATVALAPGVHRLTTSPGARVDQIRLTPADAPSARDSGEAAATIDAQVTRRTPTEIDLAISGREDGIVTSGQSYDRGWRATADGRDLGEPFELEGQSAWRVPAGTDEVHLRYGPQRWFSVALAVTGIGLAACAALLLRPRRSPDADRPAVYGRPVPPGSPPR